MNQLIRIAIFLILVACSTKKHTDNLKSQLAKIDGWEIIDFKESEIDTAKVGNRLPTAAVHITFKNESDTHSTCLTPSLDFYPIALKEYIQKKLTHHLMLRSTLFPPPPKTYSSQEYFIIGWNFTVYEQFHCCGCDSLEQALMEKLELKTDGWGHFLIP